MSKLVNALLVRYIPLFFTCCNLVLSPSCSVVHPEVEDQNCTGDNVKFPRYFSMRSSLVYRVLKRIYHWHIEVDIAYNQHIQFVVKGPLSSVIVRGLVTEHGITVLVPLHCQSYFLNYEQIKQQYDFCMHYLLIQSLLLGIAYHENAKENLQEKTNGQRDFIKYLSYTYNENTNTLICTKLVDRQHRYCINFSYRYQQKKKKKTTQYCFNDLSSIQIHVSCKKAHQFYKSHILLPKLTFKKKRSINIKAVSNSVYAIDKSHRNRL